MRCRRCCCRWCSWRAVRETEGGQIEVIWFVADIDIVIVMAIVVVVERGLVLIRAGRGFGKVGS